MIRLRSAPSLLTAGFAFLATVWAGFLGVVHLEGRGSILDRIEVMTVDLRFMATGERPPPEGVMIVEIDDATVGEAGKWSSPRDQLSALIRRIAAHRPRAIALDVLLVDEGPSDAALAESLRISPAILAAAGLFDTSNERTPVESKALPLAPEPRQVVLPAPVFLAAAGTGLVNVSTDHGGTPRHVPLLFRNGENVLLSFALGAAQIATGAPLTFEADAVRLGDRVQPLDLGYHLALRFYGPKRTIPTISALSVLRSETAAATLAGRIVVIGATAVGSGDTFETPFDSTLSGVEVFATAIGNLITGDGLVRTSAIREVDAVIAVVLAVSSVFLIAMRRIGFGLMMVGLLTAGWGAVTVIAFVRSGVWLSMALPLAAVLSTALVYSAAQVWLDRRLAGHFAASEGRFRRFHSPVLGSRLAEDPGFLAEPARIDAAIVFLDLSGYTLLSEALGPEGARTFLKTFHAIVDNETEQHGGLVISFMGDGAMLLFGFPDQKPDDAKRAIEALFALDDSLTAWLSGLPGGDMRARFGAHFGPVIVSRLGGATHQHITATGDTVNVASRLMEVAKQHHVRMAASERLCQAAGESGDRFAGAIEIAIRGRAQPLRVRLEKQG